MSAGIAAGTAFGLRPAARHASHVQARGRLRVVVPRAAGAPLGRGNSSERGSGTKSASENTPSQQWVLPAARPSGDFSEGNDARARGSGIGASTGNTGAGGESPTGLRAGVTHRAVGLVEAPETTETSVVPGGDKRPPARRKGAGKNFIRKYKSTLGAPPTDLSGAIGTSLERLVLGDFETRRTRPLGEGSYESTLQRLNASAMRFRELHPSGPNLVPTKDDDDVATIELCDGDAVVRVGIDGTITLLRRDTSADTLKDWNENESNDESLLVVSRACAGLPAEARSLNATVTFVSFDKEGGQSACELVWGDPLAPICSLRIERCGSPCDDGLCQNANDANDCCDEKNPTSNRPSLVAAWNENLHDGFVFDFVVFLDALGDPTNASAEIEVDLKTSGDWFGGGHLMRQHWPLNSGCWEVGPHYPFDNGPNGVNTLVSNNWVSSSGAAVLCDPDTPYLHVGLNAPDANWLDALGGSNRSFGVGIQNAARHVLPMDCSTHNPGKTGSGRKGDGALRLQARGSFARGKGAFQMDHPMIGWESSFDSYDEVFDTYDFGDESFDDDACIEPHVEKQNQRKTLRCDEQNRTVSMRVALCALPDVKQATLVCLKTLPKPNKPPPPEVIRAPIWTTWARYKQNVDQAKTLTFAKEILDNKLPASVMEIDDKWQSGYGELDFDLGKFPDPAGMVDELHRLGFKVTLWVMPFVEERTAAYKEGAELGYFVQSKHAPPRLKPGFFKWWNTPPVVALDVTNPAAVDWFVNRLKTDYGDCCPYIVQYTRYTRLTLSVVRRKNLQTKYGIDGFKFDAGEPCFLPRMFETHESLGHPSEYTRYWVERVAAQFELAEVRTGHGTTGVGVLTRMGDRFSEWGTANGLRSIIPTLLTSGVMGYPFCLPDMIGGNAYFGRRPDRELLVRWAQANALMPAMQFSIAPWDAGADVASLIGESLKTREKIVDTMVGLTNEACDTLAPMCRPMWWLDATDKETFRIADQFAVGDDVIVAPVVTKGANKRDVYLTKGSWVDVDHADGEVFTGGRWLRNYPAPLAKLPCFVRVET